ncbi:MAG: hypothetical protein KKG14_10050 [Alphaproteobacteria bacterium]|nr:hypothetical protein [Alphaproteobacteria bacterium]MBU2271321.1 hypothetical protein [Alphaproteobacteria bacterium]MBU2419030.1 hypothetical protein [Alphaproteobacteria bacterium]
MSDKKRSADDPRQGPLHPAAGDGVVVVKDPPRGEMLMTPDEADISGIRMLDAADEARKPPHVRVAEPDIPPVSDD